MHTQLWFTIIGFHTLVVYLPIAGLVLYLRPQLLHHILALFLGLLIAFIDQQGDDPQLTVLLLLTFGLFLGMLQHAKPWRWALLISVLVPLTSVLRVAVEKRADAFVGQGVFAMITLVPAYVGVYAGRMIHSAKRGASSPS